MGASTINIDNKIKDIHNDAWYVERMAHAHGYKIWDRDAERANTGSVIVKNLDRDGIEREYKVLRLETGQDALAIEIWIPIDPNNAIIHVTCKGTDDIAGVRADLTQEAPGEHSYRKREGYILEQINAVVGFVAQCSGKQPSLDITGHSLGGAVAAMVDNSMKRAKAKCLADDLINTSNKAADLELAEKLLASNVKFSGRMDDLAKAHVTQLYSNQCNNLGNLAEVFLGTQNSACVSPAVQESSLELLSLLKDQGTKYVHRIGFVAGDAVPTLGSYQYLLGAVTDSTALDQALIKFTGVVSEGYNTKVAKIGAAALTGAAAGGLAGPAGVFAGAAAGVVASVAKAGYDVFQAHTAYNFDANGELICGYENMHVFTNATTEGHAALKLEGEFTSNFVHGAVQGRKGIKSGIKSILNIFKDNAKKQEKMILQIPEKGKNLLDEIASGHTVNDYYASKYKEHSDAECQVKKNSKSMLNVFKNKVEKKGKMLHQIPRKGKNLLDEIATEHKFNNFCVSKFTAH